jgi:hypothetical protein
MGVIVEVRERSMRVRRLLRILAVATAFLAANLVITGNAVLHAEGEPEILLAVSIGVFSPRAGDLPSGVEELAGGDTDSYRATRLTWMNADGETPATLTPGGRFEAGTVYTVEIELTAKDGYCFTSDSSVDLTVDGVSGYPLLDEKVDVAANTLTFSALFGDTGAFTLCWIVYDGNGNTSGSPPIDGNSYESGTAPVLGNTGNLKKTGYTFSGWNTAADGTGISYNPGEVLDDLGGDVPEYEIFLFAVWDPIISEVDLAGLKAPATGDLPMAIGELPETETEFYSVTSMLWKDAAGVGDAALTPGGRFMAGSIYTAEFKLTAKPGFRFSIGCAVHLDVEGPPGWILGDPAVDEDAEENEMMFLVTFAKTADLTVTEIQVTRQPDKLSYTEVTDNILSLAGMEITETYNDGTTEIVQFADGTSDGYTSDPVHGALLTHDLDNNRTVTIRHLASGKTAQTGIITVSVPAQEDPADVVQNNPARGRPFISGTLLEGQTLTALTDRISDADGVGAFTYTWQTSGSVVGKWKDIAGASGVTFVIPRQETGKYVRVCVSYVDGIGTTETLVSIPSGPILALGPTLTADITDNDVDHEIEITFAPDPIFENAIASISYAGNVLARAQYAS